MSSPAEAIDQDAVRILAEALKTNTSLQCLEIKGYITVPCIIYLIHINVLKGSLYFVRSPSLSVSALILTCHFWVGARHHTLLDLACRRPHLQIRIWGWDTCRTPHIKANHILHLLRAIYRGQLAAIHGQGSVSLHCRSCKAHTARPECAKASCQQTQATAPSEASQGQRADSEHGIDDNNTV